MICM